MTLEEIMAEAIKSSVWKVAPVEGEPQIHLTDWSIKHTNDGDYFVGTHNYAGRVSTRIVTFDEEAQKGVTTSGRVYQLYGAPGYSSDGEYTWGVYKRINSLTEV